MQRSRRSSSRAIRQHPSAFLQDCFLLDQVLTQSIRWWIESTGLFYDRWWCPKINRSTAAADTIMMVSLWMVSCESALLTCSTPMFGLVFGSTVLLKNFFTMNLRGLEPSDPSAINPSIFKCQKVWRVRFFGALDTERPLASLHKLLVHSAQLFCINFVQRSSRKLFRQRSTCRVEDRQRVKVNPHEPLRNLWVNKWTLSVRRECTLRVYSHCVARLAGLQSAGRLLQTSVTNSFSSN